MIDGWMAPLVVLLLTLGVVGVLVLGVVTVVLVSMAIEAFHRIYGDD